MFSADQDLLFVGLRGCAFYMIGLIILNTSAIIECQYIVSLSTYYIGFLSSTCFEGLVYKYVATTPCQYVCNLDE